MILKRVPNLKQKLDAGRVGIGNSLDQKQEGGQRSKYSHRMRQAAKDDEYSINPWDREELRNEPFADDRTKLVSINVGRPEAMRDDFEGQQSNRISARQSESGSRQE